MKPSTIDQFFHIVRSIALVLAWLDGDLAWITQAVEMAHAMRSHLSKRSQRHSLSSGSTLSPRIRRKRERDRSRCADRTWSSEVDGYGSGTPVPTSRTRQ